MSFLVTPDSQGALRLFQFFDPTTAGNVMRLTTHRQEPTTLRFDGCSLSLERQHRIILVITVHATRVKQFCSFGCKDPLPVIRHGL